MMNKSALLSWSFFPNISGLTLHQWSSKYVKIVARFAYAMKQKKILNKLCSAGEAMRAQSRGNGRRNM